MKQGRIDHWMNVEKCKNLLFFAELINELLFDYSIPSNRISTLNCHYLCLDALNAIETIENHGVPQGTLKPIVEELYCELGKDPIYNVDNSPTNYFLKFKEGRAYSAHNISELNYVECKSAVNALFKIYFADNKYYDSLKELIVKLVLSNDEGKQQDLFRLTKALLTELTNCGYDIRFIYKIMHQTFWNAKSPIESPDSINVFFESFDFEQREYTVAFKVKTNKVLRLKNYYGGLELRDEIEAKCSDKSGRQFLKKGNDEKFIVTNIDAIDPFSASESATYLMEYTAAVYRLYDHYYTYRMGATPCGVFDSKGNYYRITNKNAVNHTKTPPSKQIAEKINIVSNAMQRITGNYDNYVSLLNAIRFHAHSLDSFSEENQLLDFWAIFETILDISNEHTSDRINQICIKLVPILKRKYLYSLFSQLADDIRDYDQTLFKRIVGESVEKKDILQKLCEFVLLSQNESDRQKELSLIDKYPLLKERILYYGEKMSTPQGVYQFVEKHAEKVRWQIMRIYRNRNLIIHNGNKMPYLDLLIENLHSYVDDFLAYTIQRISDGNDIESMCQELYIIECKWMNYSRNKNTISEDFIREMLSV